jgi:uncharacterized membrane protein (UPF0136 family)
MNIDASLVLYVYGALVLIGGIIGYATAKSQMSLIMGVASGVVLILAGYLAASGNEIGVYIGLVVSAALAVLFMLRYIKTKTVMPALVMAVLSDLAFILLVINKWGS